MYRDPDGANCAEIRPVLKAIDEGFDIVFDRDEESYLIMHNGHRFQTVHHTGITMELMDHLRHMTYLNKNGAVLDFVEKQEAKEEANRDRELARYAEAIAKDIHRPVVEDYLYGKG